MPAENQVVRAQLAIRELVLDGNLAALERVAEVPLSRQIGVSRTPLRMALVKLESEGLLFALPGGGYAVREFTDRYVADAIELCGALEGMAARLAAERLGNPGELRRIRACVDEIDNILANRPLAIDGFSRYVDVNARFHTELIALAHSDAVAHALTRAQSLPFASPSAFVLDAAELPESTQVLVRAQEQHRSIVDAINHGDGTRAESLVREHCQLQLSNVHAVRQHQESTTAHQRPVT